MVTNDKNMRKLFLIIPALFISHNAYSQWEMQNSGTNAFLRDIFFVDSLYGWAVGNHGTIIGTKDGGKIWKKMIGDDDSVEFKRVQFLNRGIGFVGGNTIKSYPFYTARQVKLLRTTNGGILWEQCDSSFEDDFRFGDMQFISPVKGWIGINNIGQINSVDRKGKLLQTTNGGTTWSVFQEKNALLIGALSFPNITEGYSFWAPFFDNYDNSNIDFSNNGGKSWNWVGEIEEDIVRAVKYADADNLWAIGLKISRSKDGGKNWKTWNLFNPVVEGQKRFNPSDVEVVDMENIWIVGHAFSSLSDNEGVILRTSNSGETWNSVLQIPGYFFSALSMVSPKKAWLAGSGGLIMHLNDNTTSVKMENKILSNHIDVNQNYPNPLSLNSNAALTTIQFSVKTPQRVNITIYDILGRAIKILFSEFVNIGTREVAWNGISEDGIRISSGVYFYEVRSETFIIRKKMLVIF